MLDLPKLIGYQIVDKIGAGGIATVYKTLTPDNKIVALKILSSQEPEVIERFKKEFILLSNINHPNVVRVHDFGYNSKAEPYFSMEFIAGKDLKTYFQELVPRKLYSTLLQICQTLEFLHYKSITHGDLKPSNILITSDGDDMPIVKFTDFGFAEFGKEIDPTKWKGTIPYLAPEMIRGEDYNHQVDLYSLGVMFYEVLTKELPFRQSDLMDLAQAHLDQEPEFPTGIEIPEALKEIIFKLLKKDPIDRYYSAEEVIKDLGEFVEFSPKENDILLGKSLISSSSFIERNKEFSLLHEASHRTEAGKSEIILLKGEFGSGKTRLLREFKNLVQLNNGNVSWRDSYNLDKTAFADIQNLIKKSFPSVVIIDDLQDLVSEEIEPFINYLGQIKENRLLLCLVLEGDFTLSDKDQKGSQLESKIESQAKERFSRIILQPLTKADSQRLISSICKWKQDSENVEDLIYEASGGNPFLIKWTIASLLELGYLIKVNQFWQVNTQGFEVIELPENHKSQLKKSLSYLSPESLNLLNIASILGREFNFDLLVQVSDYSRDKVRECLNEISQQKLLETQITSSGKKFVFKNGLVKNWIYTQIDESRRKSLHDLSGRAIEKYYYDSPKEVPDVLAFHYLNAENKDLALKYSFLAGEKAEKENNHAKAIGYYENALRLFDKDIGYIGLSKLDILEKLAKQYGISGDFDKALSCYSEGLELSMQEEQSPERIAKLHQETGIINFRKGDYEKAIEILREGLSICHKTQHLKVISELNTTLGWVYQRKSDYPRAISHFQKAIELLRNEVSKELGLALNGLGAVYSELGELNKALNSYQKALKIFAELQDENRTATVHMNLGLLERSRGNTKDALNYFEKSLDFEEKYQNKARLSFLYNNLALTYENLYEWDKSLEYHQKSYELKEKIKDETGLAVTLLNLGLIYLRRGALSNSIKTLLKALRLSENLKDMNRVALSCYSLGEVYLLKGEGLKSRTLLERSLRLRKELNDKSGIAESLGLLGRLNLKTGDFSTAFSQLKESLRLFDTLGIQKKMIEVSLLLTELGLRQNNATEAELHLNYAEKLFRSIEDQALKAKLRRITGLFLIQKDNIEEGLRELLEAAEFFKKLKTRYEFGLTYLEIGKIKSKQGRYKEAKGYLREALNIFKYMEITSKVKQCEDLMKALPDLTRVHRQRTQVLYQLSELLNNITDLDELLLKILDLAMEHLSAERAAVILYYPEDDSLELKAARGIELETKEDALSISRRVIRDVLKMAAPLIIEDARSDPEVSLYKSVITHNILSIICVPLTIKSKALGTIYVDHRSLTGMFSKEDSDFLKAFANLIAVALEKAQLYNRLNQEIFQLKKDLRKTYNYANIIGKSKKMQEVFHMVEKVADSKTSVLLFGESGTGKELIANLIHHTSNRKDKPFLKVNCAALPESLLESELFGVEEKVATGVAMRDGKFKQADGGTIFFDEIGDMSLSTQAKVLRVLQEREFERVGGSKTIKVNIRVISATNKDLEECMKKGTFRKDLFYRLNPVTIKIPPLRERKGDIPYLVDYFLERSSQENNKPKILIPVKVMNQLIDYPWPGNVRELANLMERVILFSENGFFPKEYLPSKSHRQKVKKLLISKRSLSEVLNNIEKEMLFSALEKSNWNQVQAALELEISEATLRRKMSKYRIKKPKK